MIKKRVGVVGYGHLGKFLVEKILSQDDLSLAFVWNRTVSAIGSEVPADCILTDLENFAEKGADLIVEVAHPSITSEFGAMFLKNADYMIGSPTALSSVELQQQLYAAAQTHGLYVPSGALWGGEDIRKMADRGTLQALKVTMTKHPTSFKLEEPLKSKLASMTGNDAVTLFDGPVCDLCPLAPNNVNTMAAAAVAAHNLGFDKVRGSIIADPGIHYRWQPVIMVEEELMKILGKNHRHTRSYWQAFSHTHIGRIETQTHTDRAKMLGVVRNKRLKMVHDGLLTDWHIVEVEVWGPGNIADNTAFYCKTVRRNPAKVGHVTGTATYNSFLSSMMYAHGKGGGFHLC